MRVNPYVNDLQKFPQIINKETIQQTILSVSKKPTSARFYANGKQLTDQDFNRYQKQLNLDSIKPTQLVQYAVVVKRANMRSFATQDKVFKTPTEINLDRFQETALFPAEVVVVLHYSLNGQWAFVTSYNYSAWVPIDSIALGKKRNYFQISSSQRFFSHNW
ncbi:MAG: SH3 domain-containing protein [Enterobacterales bacterium]|nr:SH3 domain-containing protein [Enterobacterales bacterium]